MALASVPSLPLSSHSRSHSRPLAPARTHRPGPAGPGPNSGSQLLLLLPISPRSNLWHRNRNLGGFRAESSPKTEPMTPPYNVLITGSTKGIGNALAKEFLKAGDNVVICSRSAERVESAVRSLREEFGEQRVGRLAMLGKERMSRL